MADLPEEGRVERAHLIQDTPKRPHVRLITIGFIVNEFGAPVEDCAYD